MMKKLLFVLAIASLAVAANAQVILSENWESGVGAWTDYGAGPFATLVDTDNTTPGGTWSLKTADASTNYSNAKDYILPGTGNDSKNWVATWNFKETGSTREYVQLTSYADGGASGALQQLIAFGVYNSGIDTTKYNFRVASGGVGWANTTVTRSSNVWHAMKVEQLYTAGDPSATLNFYIDGGLAGTTTTTAVFSSTRIRVGSGLSNGSHGAYYDDIAIAAVPEPGSLLALGTGLIGLIGIRRRRA